MSSVRQVRIVREKRLLLLSDQYKFIDEGENSSIVVELPGPRESPFVGMTFLLRITFTEEFPFQPPNIVFQPPLIPYHPNISAPEGAICLDVLKMAPMGSWKANLGLEAVIEAISRLLAEPNVDDPLSPDIAREYITDHAEYWRKAKL